MAARCFPLVGGRRMRATRLDGCGRPDTSQPDCAQVTTKGFVSIEVTANVEEGEAINVTNANGETCVSQTPCPTLTGYTVNLNFCNVDPDLFSLITGQDQVLDPATGEGIGFRVNTEVSGCDSGFALEVWSNVPGVACSDDPNAQGTFGYILFPFLQGGVLGDFTIENAAVTFTIQGATTKSGSGWGVGPYDVTLDADGEPGPLSTPIEAGDHMHVQVTEVAPPDDACGCGPIPTGEDPTGATAGTPGTYTPAGSNVPEDLAALDAVVADPTTAWTVGQYVDLGDGSKAYWDGTDWQAGTAPVI